MVGGWDLFLFVLRVAPGAAEAAFGHRTLWLEAACRMLRGATVMPIVERGLPQDLKEIFHPDVIEGFLNDPHTATDPRDVVRLHDWGRQVTMTATVERDGGDKPVCVAEVVFRYYNL